MRDGFFGFARANARWLAAGGLLTFSSAYGQTYFISIFAGEIRDTFALSHGAWGGIYTIGTLASAIVMIFAGSLTDRFRVRALGPIVLLALAGVCFAMATNPWVGLLPIIIFGLRLCGQGMMTQTAMVGMGRWFARSRGRANAIISMGYSAGEAVLPFVFVLIMGLIGWRGSWLVAAALALLAIPVLRLLLQLERQPGTEIAQDESAGMFGRQWSRKDALSHWLFWIAALAVASPSTFGTAFFFQQVHLTEIKGWELASFVALFPLWSVMTISSSFAFGAIADRVGTAVVFPLTMIPAAVGFALAGLGESLWAAAFAFITLGMMGGGMSTIGGAFWPEYFGTRHLGAIRAMGTSAMVFGSAVGPGVTGYLIDRGVDYQIQLLWMAGYFLVLCAVLAISFARARTYLTQTA